MLGLTNHITLIKFMSWCTIGTTQSTLKEKYIRTQFIPTDSFNSGQGYNTCTCLTDCNKILAVVSKRNDYVTENTA